MQFFNFFLFSPYELAPPPKLRVVSNLVTLNLAFGFHGFYHFLFTGLSNTGRITEPSRTWKPPRDCTALPVGTKVVETGVFF